MVLLDGTMIWVTDGQTAAGHAARTLLVTVTVAVAVTALQVCAAADTVTVSVMTWAAICVLALVAAICVLALMAAMVDAGRVMVVVPAMEVEAGRVMVVVLAMEVDCGRVVVVVLAMEAVDCAFCWQTRQGKVGTAVIDEVWLAAQTGHGTHPEIARLHPLE